MLGEKAMSDARRRQPQETRAHEDAGRVNAACEQINRFSDDEIYDHIVAMGLELRRLTKGADMRFLTYLLEMVVEEAATAPRRTRH
jgi:hypothetical protein